MKFKFLLLFAVLLFACQHKMPTPPGDGEEPPPPQWAMFGKNLRHTANAADPVEYYSGPQQGKIVWSWKTNELFWASPSVGTDGTIYVATSISLAVGEDSGFVYALNPNGTVKWRFRTNGPNLATGALGPDDTYFYPSLDNNLYAIDCEGNLKWKRRIGPFQTEARPAITKTGEVIVAAGAGVTALDLETGEVLWFYEKPMRLGFSPSIDNNGNIYTGTPNSLLALTATGSKIWERPFSYGPVEVIIGQDGTLYFHILRDTLFYALNPDGSLKWTFNTHGSPEINRPAIGPNGDIYALSPSTMPQKLYKLDPMGNEVWEIETAKLTCRAGIGYFADSSPIIDRDGTIYMTISSTGQENFWAINQKREVKWSLIIEDPSVAIFPKPAIAPDGTLYVVGDHSVNAIR